MQASFPWETPVTAQAVSEPVLFRYTGTRSLKVTGGMTGRVYQFVSPGAEVLIDARDVPGMMAAPNVERS